MKTVKQIKKLNQPLIHFLLVILMVTVSQASFSQKEKTIKLYHNDKQFFAPEVGNYLEVQLTFETKSLSFNIDEDMLTSELSITQTFSQNNTVKAFDKTRLTTPINKNNRIENLYYIERFALEPGIYSYELIVKDENSSSPELTYKKDIQVIDHSKKPSFSEIVPAAAIDASKKEENTLFSKYGYEVKPLETAFYGSKVNTLPYYTEVYHTDKLNSSTLFIKQTVYNTKDSIPISSLTRFFKVPKTPLHAIAKGIKIEELETGDYVLTLELFTKEKKLICSSHLNFERKKKQQSTLSTLEKDSLSTRFNHSIPEDSVYYYVASLIPIADGQEVKNIIRLLKTDDTVAYRNYLSEFWQTAYDESPYDAWMNYKEQVDLAEHHFGTKFQMGAETDRGRVYLQFGPPSQLSDIPYSPSEYPYQIWQYDKIGRFSNRRFVFYNPSNINEAYQLLHSDMIGELQNRRWRFELNKRNTYDGDLDTPDGRGHQEHWGGNSMQYYNSY